MLTIAGGILMKFIHLSDLHLGITVHEFSLLQASYFERVLRRANIRLMRMSDGQYELKRAKETSDQRSRKPKFGNVCKPLFIRAICFEIPI
jgi:hypothetical protein